MAANTTNRWNSAFAEYRESWVRAQSRPPVSDVDRLVRSFARLGYVCSVIAAVSFYVAWSDTEHSATWFSFPTHDRELDELVTEALKHERYQSLIAEFAELDQDYTDAIAKAKSAKIDQDLQ